MGALSPVGASRALVERACELQSVGILSVADGDASKGNGQDLMVGPGPVDPISGRYDLIALIRTKNTEMLSDIVTGSMLKIEGIVDSETLLAFRVHSKHDLDSMFSIGVE